MMNSLNKQIEAAAPFAPLASPEIPQLDHSDQVTVGLDWASRQKPETEEVQQLKPIFPVPN